MRKDLEQLTKMLCEACLLASKSIAINDDFSDELAEWWKSHKKDDEARIRDTLSDFLRENQFNKQQMQYLYDYMFSEFM